MEGHTSRMKKIKYEDERDARHHMIDIKRTMEFGMEALDAKDIEKALAAIRVAREHLVEARWLLRGSPIKNGRRV